MKTPPSLTPRVLIVLAFVALILSLLFWQQIKKKDNPASSASSPKQSNTASENRRTTSSHRASASAADHLLRAEGVRTDVTVSTFPIKEYRRLPQPSGKAAGVPSAEAYIHIPSVGHRVAISGRRHFGAVGGVAHSLQPAEGMLVARALPPAPNCLRATGMGFSTGS